jgi:4'-phosphopantetheinyl transferase
MPLVQFIEVKNECCIGIWKSTETENELLQKYNSLSISQDVGIPRLPKHRIEFYATQLTLHELCIKNGLQFSGITKNEVGKPFLKAINANISYTHSKNYVSAILSLTKAVGIDIEFESSRLTVVKNKFLTQEEQLKFASPPELCMAWTAKEAAYKLYGKKGVSLKDDIEIVDEKTIKVRAQTLTWHAIQIEDNLWLSYVTD